MLSDAQLQLCGDASACLYGLADLNAQVMAAMGGEDDLDFRAIVINIVTQVAVHVAGADGRIHPKEAEVLRNILWREENPNDFEWVRTYQKEHPMHLEVCLRALEEMIGNHAQLRTTQTDTRYTAENDSIVSTVSIVCQVVLAADGESSLELDQLGKITFRLRDCAVTTEQALNEQYPVQERSTAQPSSPPQTPIGTVEETLSELHRLVGLSSVKQEVETLANLAKVFSLRKEKGLPVPPMSFHLTFLGNPGTGKTSVARIIAKLYGQLGLLKTGHLIETDRSGLVASYVGQTAAKVQECVSRALGGVLFIDEAYSLAGKGDTDFGQEAIETLLKLMEDHRDNLIVIVAGYSHEMQTFLGSNPGLRSRFAKDLIFPDYTADEMVEIFERMAGQAHYDLEPTAGSVLRDVIAAQWEGRTASFANARDVRNYFERCISAQANRLSLQSITNDSELCQLTADDLRFAA